MPEELNPFKIAQSQVDEVAKILKLVPMTKPVFPRYKKQLTEQGRSDLANV